MNEPCNKLDGSKKCGCKSELEKAKLGKEIRD